MLYRDIMYEQPSDTPNITYAVVCVTTKCVIFKCESQLYRTVARAMNRWNTRA